MGDRGIVVEAATEVDDAIRLGDQAASLAVALTTVVERFEAEIAGLQMKLSATRESLLAARRLQSDSIQELRRVGSDAWITMAADEIAGAVSLKTETEISPLWIADILRRYRDHGPAVM